LSLIASLKLWLMYALCSVKTINSIVGEERAPVLVIIKFDIRVNFGIWQPLFLMSATYSVCRS